MSMKNFNDTIWDRTSDLPICSTTRQPLCHRGPKVGTMNTQTWMDIKLQQKKNTDVSLCGSTAITMLNVWTMWYIAEFKELLKFSCQ
jgi:hypothetical protein